MIVFLYTNGSPKWTTVWISHHQHTSALSDKINKVSLNINLAFPKKKTNLGIKSFFHSFIGFECKSYKLVGVRTDDYQNYKTNWIISVINVYVLMKDPL